LYDIFGILSVYFFPPSLDALIRSTQGKSHHQHLNVSLIEKKTENILFVVIRVSAFVRQTLKISSLSVFKLLSVKE